jgi:hypothetical protein
MFSSPNRAASAVNPTSSTTAKRTGISAMVLQPHEDLAEPHRPPGRAHGEPGRHDDCRERRQEQRRKEQRQQDDRREVRGPGKPGQ